MFTALVAFNDVSAIGAIRALQDANLRVPADVSVIGFDDIKVSGIYIATADDHPSASRGVRAELPANIW